MEPVRVLIADDHDLFAKTLEAVLADDERIVVVGRAREGKEAVRMALGESPDVVLMDLEMPIMDGFEATEELRGAGSRSKVLVLTSSDATNDAERAFAAGAAAYLTKDRVIQELKDAIVSLARRRA
jgi:DNA-binding NarL/FixJ family response regulator